MKKGSFKNAPLGYGHFIHPLRDMLHQLASPDARTIAGGEVHRHQVEGPALGPHQGHPAGQRLTQALEETSAVLMEHFAVDGATGVQAANPNELPDNPLLI